MTQVYSTQELLAILAEERQACIQGERLNLGAKASGNPVIDRLLRVEGIQKFTAYRDFKATIHRYQQEYLVSGILWREVTVKGKTLRYPAVDDELIALRSDLEVLRVAKTSVLAFWWEVTVGMDLYLSRITGYQAILPEEVEAIATRTEWATLWKWENPNFLEIGLQLAWGKPEEAAYRWALPMSGSEYIHAVNPGSSPIG